MFGPVPQNFLVNFLTYPILLSFRRIYPWGYKRKINFSKFFCFLFSKESIDNVTNIGIH
ncbi:hypothetical protein LEP1GSC199_2987 [Leptospira vanthielii serovar Holland str. Waz Holland = ATCC 700522]|uniref:Uncharacterized protein n=1 Tax=Leptospira vanthielii serovar Holland str. Waz Holland = ATCC 700522 TaxID=1218591 RepID=N1W908_9LEPT|nr:hypothetical protein LEP1GSC199_2987 [Leptospira vanthielii serovar Holland str. Waz Holland = ATCC 700522]